MSAREPSTGEPSPHGGDPAALGGEAGAPRYEPAPAMGKLLLWVLLFVLAAVVVVVGGVYFS
ncbi:hypothetical protein ABZX90_07440 [Streptomyces sp. NPDC002935]|uniref:hypothetical protein n=1 Tax=unclassified Streptomyces TaxID=2593676 RepID=UPI0033293D2D